VGTRHQFRVVINFWQTRFALVRPDNHTLLRYRPKGVLRQEADMDICDGAKEIQELPWLMLFGWYLVVLLQRDAAAAAV
jgi:hypothetical protein